MTSEKNIMNNYTPTIGIEIHTELKTKSKMFCGCKNPSTSLRAGEQNKFVCPVCLGLPGAMPVFNKKAIEDLAMIGQAVGGKISDFSKWDRKNYFYPDLPKGFQISQFDMPLVKGGQIEITNLKSQISNKNQIINNKFKTIQLTRIHLEEDTGKLFHPAQTDYSLIDYNRSGVPLVEIVTEPMIESGEQAVAFAKEYQLILRYLKVADAEMEKGQMRVEANISLASINPKSEIRNPKQIQNLNDQNSKLGTKVEIKNLNSFRSLQKAIDYEIKRQTEVLEKGEKVVQETRGWDEGKQMTFTQRIKETSADYRYFPEPDLPPIVIGEFSIFNFQFSKLPELPQEKRERYAREYGLADNIIEIIITNIDRMKIFEELAEKYPDKIKKIALIVANSKANEMENIETKLAETGGNAISEIELEKIIAEVLSQNSDIVEKINAGKIQAIQALVGQAMAKTQGKANPQIILDLLKIKLEI
ncbi:MAG: aspartyl-tRNA(Asn)/glutamyl-tRNA (Gln) amidotransferase subunit B [Candidatus Berkelbacteria bacterium Licking1014_85]|uniref:Aspartyl/glutamyl-tRNA(Asn/Gln) amidotransferase subunit B n=1 Tax=Candidatus Berkelbacteria bacterium Licking1014_85 TaxID=2017148 RepID=A0A554LIJ4_9BACT|nr:MAG: aspartyl-tRNA(Asn)/glutamyl-tRNA (Gln) amidotransferase subunit B [Candidatus Berkelbacteria bacterium Licking1014_85]